MRLHPFMDISKIDLLIEFALAAAGQEDHDNRQLGPIHLVKYVYLGDLAYAKYHNGKTFTRTEWRFYHFGPWVYEVYERIEPVILETGAREERYSHPQYEDDFVRWTLIDEDLYLQLERELPFEVTSTIKRAIHRFGSDTSGLLHYVYNTEPMLKAAPEEILSFEVANQLSNTKDDNEEEKETLTVKAKKKRKAKIDALREKIKKGLAQKRRSIKLVPSPTPPRYDEVFYEGQKWLDKLAGQPIEEESGLLTISDDFWKSPARFDPNVS